MEIVNMNLRQISTILRSLVFGVIVLSLCQAAPVDLVGELINEINPDGYDLMYSLTNGVTRSEVGLLTTASDGTLSITVKGTWSQPYENDLYYDIEFSADEKGFRPRFILQKDLRRKVKG